MSQPTKRPLRIGVVAWNALPAIMSSPEAADHCPIGGSVQTECFGGMETAMWTLCRSLAKLPDVEVTAFVRGNTPRNGTLAWPKEIAGVKLSIHIDRFHRVRRNVSERVDFGARKLKSFDGSLLWQVPLLAITRPFRRRDPVPCQPDPRLSDAHVDAWITFGVNANSSMVIASGKSKAVPVLTSVRSNAGTDPRIATEDFLNSQGENSIHQRFVIENSDGIICQTKIQRDQISSCFDRDATVIRNAVATDQWRPSAPKDTDSPVLWIGRYDSFHKRPLMMIDVARRLPATTFRMIINPFDESVRQKIHVNLPPNVSIVPRVEFKDMPSEFHNCRLFVSTGNPEHEGFPNVLLQAAASHTPIVSTSDYDALLSKSGAGVAVGDDVDAITTQVDASELADRINWSHVDQYLTKHHSTAAIAEQHLDVLNRLLENN